MPFWLILPRYAQKQFYKDSYDGALIFSPFSIFVVNSYVRYTGAKFLGHLKLHRFVQFVPDNTK